MLYICINLIHMFLMYCLANQTVLELNVVHLIVLILIFHCGHPSRIDITVLLFRLN